MGGEDPERDAGDEREERGRDDELERPRQALEDVGGHGIAALERAPQVPPHQVTQVGRVLRAQRPVEAELVAHRGDARRRRVGAAARAEQELRGVAGQQVQEGEQQRDHDVDEQDRHQDAPENVHRHRLAQEWSIVVSSNMYVE